MKTIKTIGALEELGRVRLSKSFFMRDFLYSEIANFHGIPNIPEDPDLAIAAGTRLCADLLEPLNDAFGGITIRSAYRSSDVNGFGNAQQKDGKKGYNCGSNEKNHAKHIWDRKDKDGAMGATACIQIPWFADRYDAGADWRALAWWIHDHLPYSEQFFFPKRAALNLTWSEKPKKVINSYIAPKGTLTKPGMPNNEGTHSACYPGFPGLQTQLKSQDGAVPSRT